MNRMDNDVAVLVAILIAVLSPLIGLYIAGKNIPNVILECATIEYAEDPREF